MMHTVHQGNEHPGQSSGVFLPINRRVFWGQDMHSIHLGVPLQSCNETPCYTMLHHVTPIITVDQPLCWKAAEIIIDAPQNNLERIVLMLGSFHTFMNLLGAKGTLMMGTGLLLIVVYGENAVVRMMTGKSVQRSFRGHLLVDKCLKAQDCIRHVDDSPEFAAMVEQSLRRCTLQCWQGRRLWKAFSHLIQWSQLN